MKIKKLVIGLCIFTVFVLTVSGQSIDNVQFPPDVKWKKIETSKFILIFPESLEQKAEEIAGELETYYPADESSLNTAAMKWPIIINNSLIYSNAYVMGAPRHSQLYTVPSQDGFMGTSEWLYGIWSHELRHIVQNDKMLRGFTEFAYWVAGEYGASGMSNFAVPRWLIEGDAVLTETMLTTSGRGRLADFERVLRTNLLGGVEWNYYKSGLGYYASYRSNVPSWYVMGYHLSEYVRSTYGIDAFNKILDISADFSFTPLIFNIAVKKVTGSTIQDIYADCMEQLTTAWEEQLEGREFSSIKIVKQAEEDQRSEFFPLGVFEDGSIAAYRTSFSSLPSLVRITAGGRTELISKINPFSDNISFNGKTFCWIETKQDVRWGNRSWSVVRVLDGETGESRIITDKSRYLSPSISPDGKRIAAVELTEQLDTRIVIIDAESGQLLKNFEEPDGASALQTCWNSDGTAIVYVRQQDWKKSLQLLNPETGINTALTEPASYNISDPKVINGKVYFISEETGLENIHAVNLDGSSQRLVVSRPFGAASPAGGADGLLFADYSAAGYSIAETDFGPGLTAEEYEGWPPHVDFFTGIADQEPWYGSFGADRGPGTDTDAGKDNAPSPEMKITGYSPLSGLINFHSRSIGYTNSGSGIALTFQADDILNYSSGRIYAGYDPYYRELAGGFSGAWAGFFPVLLYGAEVQTPLASPGTEIDANMYGGFWIPLDFSEGIYSRHLTLKSLLLLQKQLYPDQPFLSAVQAQAAWSMYEYKSKRDILPPLGADASVEWYYNISPAYYNFISASAGFYLPGFLPNNGVKISMSTDYNFGAYGIKSPENVPRGYLPSDFSQAVLLNTGVDYSLPVIYPDFAIGNLLYISRIYTNCFLDAAFAWNISPGFFYRSPNTMIQTTGMEFYTDFHLFGNTVPLRTGIRILYDISRGTFRIEDTVLLLGITVL